jgi:hypothetical protein
VAPDRSDVRFRSGAEECGAWLYRPEDEGPRPIVVLGHGLGAVKEMRLDAYAERFLAAGFGALVFDYRHFGASGGEPRQLLDIARQLEDWRAAVSFAHGLPWVDPDRVAIFGSSFGGGHAILTAANDPRIAAAIAQCPFTDGLSSALTLGPLVRKGRPARRPRPAGAGARRRAGPHPPCHPPRRGWLDDRPRCPRRLSRAGPRRDAVRQRRRSAGRTADHPPPPRPRDRADRGADPLLRLRRR